MKAGALKAIIAVLLLAVVAVAIVIGVSIVRNSQSCTIGISGTAASVTFQGYKSDYVCQIFLSLNKPENAQQIYQMTTAPQGAVLCEGEYAYDGINKVHYIIRDSGLLDTEGSQLCNNFAAFPTPVP